MIEHEKTGCCPYLFGQQQGAEGLRSRPRSISGRSSPPSPGPSFPGESAEDASRPTLAPRPFGIARGSQGGGSPAGCILPKKHRLPGKTITSTACVLYQTSFQSSFFYSRLFYSGFSLKQITVRLSDSDYTIFRKIKVVLNEKKDATALRLLISRFDDLHSIVDSLKKESLENRVAIRYLEKRNAELIENNLSSMEK